MNTPLPGKFSYLVRAPPRKNFLFTPPPLLPSYCRRGDIILFTPPPPTTLLFPLQAGRHYLVHSPLLPSYSPCRRGDIILFTENACDILYLEQMYSKKIRELYEQQIKTVHDLNRCIMFYGSKNPVSGARTPCTTLPV